jgi:hypothetical protein
MIILDECCCYCWSSIDGEQFVGDQEFFYEQDHQDQFEQGKYSMRLSLLSYSYQANNIIMHIFLVKDDLELILFLDTYYIAWISIASAQH